MGLILWLLVRFSPNCCKGRLLPVIWDSMTDRFQPLQDMSHKRSYPNTHHAYPACMGCAWSWMPSAAVTFRIVATLGLPSPDNAL